MSDLTPSLFLCDCQAVAVTAATAAGPIHSCSWQFVWLQPSNEGNSGRNASRKTTESASKTTKSIQHRKQGEAVKRRWPVLRDKQMQVKPRQSYYVSRAPLSPPLFSRLIYQITCRHVLPPSFSPSLVPRHQPTDSQAFRLVSQTSSSSRAVSAWGTRGRRADGAAAPLP